MAFGGDNADSYYDEGLTASMRGDLVRAVEFFERAIRLDNTLVAAYHQLGRCYYRLNQPEKAVDLLQQVVRAKPGQIPPRIDLAYALLDLEEAEQARTVFADVLAQKPQETRATIGLAQCAFAAGNWEVAVHIARTVADETGGFAALYLLGRAAKFADQPDVARESLTRADAIIEKQIESTPNQPEGHYLRGELCVGRGNLSDALDHYRAAEERADAAKYYQAFGERFSRLDVMMKRAICLHQLGREDAARELAEQILRADPDFAGRAQLEDLTGGAS